LTVCAGLQVDPKIFEDLKANDYASFSIHLKLRADLSGAKKVDPFDRDAKGWFVYNTLKAHADETQAPLIELIKQGMNEGVVKRYTPFFVANCIIVEAKIAFVELIAKRSEVKALNSNSPFKVMLEESEQVFTQRENETEWNIDYVKAPIVWENYGKTGEGAIVANADTGIDYLHPVLYANYKGNSNGTMKHDYNWWDGVKVAALPGVGVCGINSQSPCDDNSHGTHCMGTSVGLNGIGVAPGARWIGCRNMDRGFGTPESYLSCLQFFLAPTDLNGQNPDVSVRPHVVGNSYGCTTEEGCKGTELHEAVQALRASGIFMSVSAGNEGSACSTVGNTPGFEADVVSVGATAYLSDEIASYSSRGPAGAIMKPDISAPGSSVRSCIPGGGYGSKSGTSMASPHVTGAIALLTSICPSLEYNVDAFQYLLEFTAKPLYTTQGCGGDLSTSHPNNVYGYGLLDLNAAAIRCTSKRSQE